MNIFKFALNFEKEQKEFYQKEARGSENKYLKKIFNDLAEEEKKHEKIVEQLAEEKNVDHIESDILPKVKEVFEKIATTRSKEKVIPEKQVDVYKRARKMESESYIYYKTRAEETELPFVRRVFESLAKEEKKHETIMRNLVEFVDRPSTWLDDAEWYHSEDY